MKYVSKQFASMLGYDSPEALMQACGGSFVELVHPDEREQAKRDAEKYYAGVGNYSVALRLKCRDGSWKYVENHGRRVVSANGEIEYWNLMVDKHELVTKSIDLEAARQANEAKTEFLSRMSHDIRTLLNGILGLLDQADRHPEDAKLLAEIRRKAHVVTEHLLELLNDALELNQVRFSDAQLPVEALDLNRLLAETKAVFLDCAKEKQIDLHMADSFALDHPYVWGSEAHVRQILSNILSNAVKYNRPQGSVWVTADQKPLDAGGVQLSVQVKDSGVGMSPEFLSRIYVPFAQERKDARSEYAGNGLGLPIVKGLLESHSYNASILQFAAEKGFACEAVYYQTQAELNRALVENDVDAVVNSYIRIPEDERTIENFGQTPYYFMARKEDQPLLDQIDSAINQMNVQTPNWRSTLFNRYYGSQENSAVLSDEEAALLRELQASKAVIRGVQNPAAAPCAWYENDQAMGISANLFRVAAEWLGLDYEIIPVETQAEYADVLESGLTDISITPDSYSQYVDTSPYKLTDPYLKSTVSVVYDRSTTGVEYTAVTCWNSRAMRNIIYDAWPNVRILTVDRLDKCLEKLGDARADGAVLPTYTAQLLARENVRGNLQVDILPGAAMDFCMGMHQDLDAAFYGLWQKALMQAWAKQGEKIVQAYVGMAYNYTLYHLLIDHPAYIAALSVGAASLLFFALAFLQMNWSRRKQKQVSAQLAESLKNTRAAVKAKEEFFSKMSHDIRTPMNVVLGMAQVAQKYKQDPENWKMRWIISKMKARCYCI